MCVYQTPHDPSFITENMETDFPSVIACSKTKGKGFLYCQGAEKHSECTLCESKRLLGMCHDNPHIQELIKKKHFDVFTLVPDKGGRVKVEFVKGGKSSDVPLEGQRDDPQTPPRADLQDSTTTPPRRSRRSSASRRTSRTSSAQRRCGRGRRRASR